MSTSLAADQTEAGGREHAVLQDQFTQPCGMVGRIVGWIMAWQNAAMNRFAIRAMRVRPGEDVLEIGFGPGHAIQLLESRTKARRIAGVDPSAEMLEQAEHRNREAVEAGRIVLAKATAESLPFDDQSFHHVFAVSNFLIWDSPEKGLAEVRRVLKPGGTLVICLRRAPKTPRWWKSPGATPQEIATSRQLLVDTRFYDVHTIERRLRRRIICLIATR